MLIARNTIIRPSSEYVACGVAGPEVGAYIQIRSFKRSSRYAYCASIVEPAVLHLSHGVLGLCIEPDVW